MNKRVVMFLVIVFAIAIGGRFVWSQETMQLPRPKQSKPVFSHVDPVFTMGSITAADSEYYAAPWLPTRYFDLSYFSVAADDTIAFCFYSPDSSISVWRPIPKLTAAPITRYFSNVPIYGIGVVRADTANTYYEIMFYHNPK